MRALLLAFLFLFAALSPDARGQMGGGPAPAAIKTFSSSSEVAALIAKAKAERKDGQAMVPLPILSLAPYRATLEYRAGLAPASVHETEAELMYVLEGSGTIVTGGKLTEEKRTNPTNLSGAGIAGGTPQPFAKGDFIIVPENTPHQTAPAAGSVIVLMTFHVPRPVAWR
jgi:mannose-6-phosphate isomerase-like protein (cupin superfamily)